jgi:hypothetical protein
MPMIEMSDREWLEKRAREKEQARQRAEAARRQPEAREAGRQAGAVDADRRRTEEVYRYAQQTLAGFELVPTDLALVVGRAVSSKVLPLRPDGVEYVTLNVPHWDERTDFRGKVPIAAARCRAGKYEVVDLDRTTVVDTFDELREQLLDLVADMGDEYVAKGLRRLRVFHG